MLIVTLRLRKAYVILIVRGIFEARIAETKRLGVPGT